MTWKDTSSWSRTCTDRTVPKEWTLQTDAGLRICVHHHIAYRPDVWLVSAYLDGGEIISRHELASFDATEAKRLALSVVAHKLSAALSALSKHAGSAP